MEPIGVAAVRRGGRVGDTRAEARARGVPCVELEGVRRGDDELRADHGREVVLDAVVDAVHDDALDGHRVAERVREAKARVIERLHQIVERRARVVHVQVALRDLGAVDGVELTEVDLQALGGHPAHEGLLEAEVALEVARGGDPPEARADEQAVSALPVAELDRGTDVLASVGEVEAGERHVEAARCVVCAVTDGLRADRDLREIPIDHVVRVCERADGQVVVPGRLFFLFLCDYFFLYYRRYGRRHLRRRGVTRGCSVFGRCLGVLGQSGSWREGQRKREQPNLLHGLLLPA